MKEIYYKYSHVCLIIFGMIYFPCFSYLEAHITENFYPIHCFLDEYIPFMEIFIVPYYLWFVYVALVFLYFYFSDKKEFGRVVLFNCIGMTLFLIISALFPNGLYLRPLEFPRDNIFTDMVRFLYSKDTPTNVLPSLHVYNTLCCHLALLNDKRLKEKPVILSASRVLSFLIVLSTMFLKQHSVIDVIAAYVMSFTAYHFLYCYQHSHKPKFIHQT